MINGSKGEQLAMFMSPRDVSMTVDAYGDFPHGNPKTGLPHEDMKQLDPSMEAHKTSNSARRGLEGQGGVAYEGVHEPISIWHGKNDYKYLANGHHRTLAQSKSDPDRLMPVEHRGAAQFGW